MAKKSKTVRVCLIKAVPVKWDLEANWSCFEALARQGARRGARIVCTPECFLDGYVVQQKKGFTAARFRKVSQPVKGEGYVKKARALARELGIYLVFGFTERAARGYYNSAALIDPRGRLQGTYHKIHTGGLEQKRYIAGRRLPVWKTDLGPLGIMICADRRWPETARTLRVGGALLIMNPTYGMWHLDNEWWMRTRSYENECYICFTHGRVSLITGPQGELAAKLQSNLPDILVHDIDLADMPDYKMNRRRPKIYEI